MSTRLYERGCGQCPPGGEEALEQAAVSCPRLHPFPQASAPAIGSRARSLCPSCFSSDFSLKGSSTLKCPVLSSSSARPRGQHRLESAVSLETHSMVPRLLGPLEKKSQVPRGFRGQALDSQPCAQRPSPVLPP